MTRAEVRWKAFGFCFNLVHHLAVLARRKWIVFMSFAGFIWRGDRCCFMSCLLVLVHARGLQECFPCPAPLTWFWTNYRHMQCKKDPCNDQPFLVRLLTVLRSLHGMQEGSIDPTTSHSLVRYGLCTACMKASRQGRCVQWIHMIVNKNVSHEPAVLV